MTFQSDIAGHYARIQIATAKKPKVICLLHERCLALINASMMGPAPCREYLDKAQNILAQLERSIRIDDHVSQSMYYLYDYCYCRLESGDPEEHRKAHRILSVLRETFDALLHPFPAAIMELEEEKRE